VVGVVVCHLQVVKAGRFVPALVELGEEKKLNQSLVCWAAWVELDPRVFVLV